MEFSIWCFVRNWLQFFGYVLNLKTINLSGFVFLPLDIHILSICAIVDPRLQVKLISSEVAIIILETDLFIAIIETAALAE